MAGESRSLQDLIRARRQSGFVGRQGQVVQYRENLGYQVDDEGRRFLFNIHGDAGVGKTYLTKRLKQTASDMGALTAYIDESIDDITSTMDAMTKQFARSGIRLKEFEKRSATYRQKRHELESDPQAPDGVATFVTKAAVKIGLHAARDVPFAGSLIAPIDLDAAADQIDRARAYLARKFSDYTDVRLLLSPAEELTPVFVANLNHEANDLSVALFFDTYERTAPILDNWLRDLYGGRYGNLPAGLVTTISGQYPLNPNVWGDYLPVIADIPLEPFSVAEARQFLASKDIIDEPTIGVILNLSGRLPLWLATLAEARPDDASHIGDPAGSAIERFLEWEDDPDCRATAVLAALPRSLNRDVLIVIAASDKKSDVFAWLCSLPFVTWQAESWKYHEVVRAAMLRLQRAQSPSQWRSNHASLAQAYARWAVEAAGDGGKIWSSPDSIDDIREVTYHMLCSDPVNNLPGALATAVKAAENSVVRARQWAELLLDAARDTDNAVLRKWGQQLQDSIHGNDLGEYLTHLINEGELDQASLILAFEERGIAYRQAGRGDEAIADFNRAIELDPNRTWSIAGHGETCRLMERYDEAIADFNRAIELAPSFAWAIAHRGQTYRAMERYDEALADFNRAIELDPSANWVIAHRGQTFHAMKRYNEALADFNRAIELDPSYDWAIGSRGQTFHAMKRYDDAIADYNRAIELDPSYDWAIVSRDVTYWAMKRYDDAIADFNRVIELDPSADWAIAGRGETCRLMERYDEALADFNRAIELDPSYDWAIASRGQTYRAMERYDDAICDFNRAIELDPSFAWAIASRGQTYHAMERYDDAIADFNRAIELDPSYDWAIASRGQTYRAMERYDDAIADFNRALELDPSFAWAIASRGQTYHAMERYDDAIADFNRAIELDPSADWAIVGRGETCRLMERYDEALADFNRAIELDPSFAWAIASRGQTYHAMERYDDAIADFNRAIELDPSADWAIVGRGETCRLMERYDEALADFNRAIELDPSFAWAIASRGQTYHAMERYDDAIADFNRAIELDPSADWAIAQRGQTYHATKRYDDAIADYNRAIELNPSLAGKYDAPLAQPPDS